MSAKNFGYRSEYGPSCSQVIKFKTFSTATQNYVCTSVFLFSIKIRRIDFPREVIRGETLYTNMIIDETTSRPENHCDDVYIYITDTVEPGKFNSMIYVYFIVN